MPLRYRVTSGTDELTVHHPAARCGGLWRGTRKRLPIHRALFRGRRWGAVIIPDVAPIYAPLKTFHVAIRRVRGTPVERDPEDLGRFRFGISADGDVDVGRVGGADRNSESPVGDRNEIDSWTTGRPTDGSREVWVVLIRSDGVRNGGGSSQLFMGYLKPGNPGSAIAFIHRYVWRELIRKPHHWQLPHRRRAEETADDREENRKAAHGTIHSMGVSWPSRRTSGTDELTVHLLADWSGEFARWETARWTLREPAGHGGEQTVTGDDAGAATFTPATARHSWNGTACHISVRRHVRLGNPARTAVSTACSTKGPMAGQAAATRCAPVPGRTDRRHGRAIAAGRRWPSSRRMAAAHTWRCRRPRVPGTPRYRSGW